MLVFTITAQMHDEAGAPTGPACTKQYRIADSELERGRGQTAPEAQVEDEGSAAYGVRRKAIEAY